MVEQVVKIPDIGGATDVDVIEVLVKPGDVIEAEAALLTLEGDKATMDVPSPSAGKVVAVSVAVGDKVSEGDAVLTLALEANEASVPTATDEATSQSRVTETAAAAVDEVVAVRVPDLGGASDVDVIEVLVQVGDEIAEDAPLLTLEGDKATMDVPSALAGRVVALKVAVGDKVSEGDVIVELASAVAAVQVAESPVVAPLAEKKPVKAETSQEMMAPATTEVYAGPAVRRLAFELDVDLSRVKGTGEKGRVTKADLKRHLSAGASTSSAAAALPFKLAPLPKIDFAKFGEVETLALNKIKRATAANMHRNWVGIPHVTQFDKADITDMEAFRQKQKAAAAAEGVKLTPIVFIMKAVVSALRAFPRFNASLDASGENLILKKYFHIGVAVDTPQGLVVPVIRDVDRKSLFDLAKELGEVSQKARTEGLSLAAMQGGCFTISSLGGIGGTAFTPIVNAPEVAILGVSKSEQQPVFDADSGQFVPRLMLPLSLSYDHRVIDGAEAARFSVFLASRLADIKTLLL